MYTFDIPTISEFKKLQKVYNLTELRTSDFTRKRLEGEFPETSNSILVKGNLPHTFKALSFPFKDGKYHFKVESLKEGVPYKLLLVIRDKTFMNKITSKTLVPLINYSVAKFGRYPTSKVTSEWLLQEKLHNEYNQKRLLVTGNTYSGESEYVFDDDAYVFVENTFQNKKYTNEWFKVKDLYWIYDKNQNMLVLDTFIDAEAFYNIKSVEYDIMKTLYRIGASLRSTVNENSMLLTQEENEIMSYRKINKKDSDYFSDLIIDNYSKTDLCIHKHNLRSKEEKRPFTGDFSHYFENPIEHSFIVVTIFANIKDNYEEIIDEEGNHIVIYGEYPQKLIDIDTTGEIPTGKKYSFIKKDENDKKSLISYKEYICNGIKYVKIDGLYYKVLPIEWVKDNKTNALIMTKKQLFNFDLSEEEFEVFLNKYFSKDIIPSYVKSLDSIESIISSNIAIQMLMNKENISIADLELDNESKLALRRKQ